MPQSDTSHPADIILTSPLQDESRRNRRALLSVASVCIALRVIGKVPEQISAVGITFAKSDTHIARVLIWLAVGVQSYLLLVFVLSAIGDYLLWRRALRKNIKAYALTDCKFEVGEAVELGVEDLAKVPWKIRKLEASDTRMKHVFGSFGGPLEKKKQGDVIRMIWHTHPWTVAYLVVIFLFPILWCVCSVISLLTWTPSIR